MIRGCRVSAVGSVLDRRLPLEPFLQFWIFPRGVDLGWMNIFHHGNDNYQRSPAVWFYPQYVQFQKHIKLIECLWHMRGA